MTQIDAMPTLSCGEFFDDMLNAARPALDQHPEVMGWRMRNFPRLHGQAMHLSQAFKLGIPTLFGSLNLSVTTHDGEVLDYGLSSLRVVTTAGVNYIVQVFIATGGYSLNNFKYHGIGTGTTAEATGDTALVTELTTQYNPDSTRATGTTVAGSSSNIFHTVATNTVDATAAITEHGILSQAATGGGTLLDRSVFSVINLSGGDGLTSTYDLTLAAGG
jgi:hypothetical protein